MLQKNEFKVIHALPQEGDALVMVTLLEQYIQSLSYKKALGYLGLNLGNLITEIVDASKN